MLNKFHWEITHGFLKRFEKIKYWDSHYCSHSNTTVRKSETVQIASFDYCSDLLPAFLTKWLKGVYTSLPAASTKFSRSKLQDKNENQRIESKIFSLLHLLWKAGPPQAVPYPQQRTGHKTKPTIFNLGLCFEHQIFLDLTSVGLPNDQTFQKFAKR